MSRLNCVAVLSLALLGICSVSVQAQVRSAPGGPTRFQPARPTISPYLDFYRINNGVLPNYHTYVRPRIRQRALNQRQQGINQQQQFINQQGSANVNLLHQQMMQQLRGPVRPTGVGATFRNFGGYYSGLR